MTLVLARIVNGPIVRAGYVRNITYRDAVMEDVANVLEITQFYHVSCRHDYRWHLGCILLRVPAMSLRAGRHPAHQRHSDAHLRAVPRAEHHRDLLAVRHGGLPAGVAREHSNGLADNAVTTTLLSDADRCVPSVPRDSVQGRARQRLEARVRRCERLRHDGECLAASQAHGGAAAANPARETLAAGARGPDAVQERDRRM